MSADGSWSLLDYGNIVVHVFMPETREYYRLEALWNDAPVIDLAAEAGLENLQYSDRRRLAAEAAPRATGLKPRPCGRAVRRRRGGARERKRARGARLREDAPGDGGGLLIPRPPRFRGSALA